MRCFIGSPFFLWMLSLFLYVFSLVEDSLFIEKKRIVNITKLVIYQGFIFKIIGLKSKNHQMSITPLIIDFTLKNFTEHLLFGLAKYTKFAFLIRTCWFLIDTFHFAHIIFNNKISALLKYKFGIVLFGIHGILESMSTLKFSLAFSRPISAFLLLFYFFHLISLKVLFNYKLYQLMWYRKKRKLC